MVSNRHKIAAIIVIIVVVLASFTILLTNYNPQTSKARAMILVADDIIDGTHWYEFFAGDESPPLEPNTTS